LTVDACAGRLPTTLCLSVSDQRRDTAERASERERERAKERAREGEEARAHLGDGEEELLAELLVALVARGQVELCVHEQVVVSEWTLSEHEERREARERENERSEEGRESDARLKHWRASQGHNADADEADDVDYTVLRVEQQRAAVGSMCDGPSKPR